MYVFIDTLKLTNKAMDLINQLLLVVEDCMYNCVCEQLSVWIGTSTQVERKYQT